MIHPLSYIYIMRKHGSRHHAVVLLMALLISLFTPLSAMAEIVIGGNVYGGGNEGDVDGSTSVTVQQGTLQGNVYGGGNIADLRDYTNVTVRGGFVYGSVYGGARMANIGGHTMVHIDGTNQTANIVLKAVYGGNDIAGSIGTLGKATLGFRPKLEDLKTGTFNKNNFNAFVYTSGNAIADKPFVIGSLYGGGNGAYDYIETDDGKYKVNVDDTEYTITHKPDLANTYIEIGGGFFGHVFGGGNKATITENTVIYAENKTPFNGVVNHVCSDHAEIIDLDDRHFRRVEHADKDGHYDLVFDHHIAGLFGGNNLADMTIRPTWYLRKSRINNLYSGGNKGRMTHPNGIVLPLRSDSIRINNVYGGCRFADVYPGDIPPTSESISTWDFVKNEMTSYTITEGYSTRVLITGGHFNNVYGGNDIAGTVYHGANIELHGGRTVNVYGGGNGSYAYTDQESWVEQHPDDADFYYSVPEGSTSLQALHKHRPHVKNTLIYITGHEHDNPLVVAGEVYCGGNSATLADKDGLRVNANATLRIGKHAIIDGVFLGSNGANMVTEEMFRKYADRNFSSIDLMTEEGMKSYLGSVAVYTIPNLEWDEDIDETYIGSLHYGGNKGSMTYSGMATINVPREIVIYEKVVGGCNDACVKGSDYNAEYHGGLLEKGAPYNGMDNVKICLNVDAYLQPRELVLTYMDNNLFVDNCSFVLDTLKRKTIETFDNKTLVSPTYVDANIYGGCYTSGHVKGDVVININKPLIHPKVFENEFARSVLHATGEDVYGSALAVYGGGYGELAIVEGNTQINLTDSASTLLVFGGGEMGVVKGNTEVNFAHDMMLPTDESHSIAHNINVYKAYAAGYEGDVEGNATLNLRSGGVLRGFGGACNADVLGTTTAIVGWRDEEGDEYNYGLPYVANAVFGGNDFGGQVYGDTLRNIQVRDYSGNVLKSLQVRSQSYVQYLSGNIGKALYGGSYGSYDYRRTDIYNTAPEKGFKDPEFTKPISPDNANVIATNTFVHIDSKSRDEQDIIGSATHKDPTIITGIVGGGRGYRNLPGHVEVKKTYVLLNGTDYTLRNNATPMAYRVYGGGNLSMVHDTRIDAYSGTVKQIFGGTHGVKTENMVDLVPYNVGSTLINYYESMAYPLTDIFGAGANSGAEYTLINLYGGNVNNVHGGAYTEGYTWNSEINVPEHSTIHANAIFGGGLGEEEGRPCDVGVAIVNYFSENATVELGLFGGNNTARATKESHINVNVPVLNSNGMLQSVYGAGYGNATVAGFTHIDLMPGAHVAKVYGGGKEGKVYNHYKYYGDAKNAELDAILKFYYDKSADREPYGHNANWTTEESQANNTFIKIQQGAVVEENAFGGGEGVTAYVNGQTHVELLGGIVKKDIYGAGDAGDMNRMVAGVNGYISDEENRQTIATRCDIQGGQVRKVFGGGLNGNVEGNTHVIIGKKEADSFYDGVPAILRNVYGGSERGLVTGWATVDMNNGYIGYEYRVSSDESMGMNADEKTEVQLAGSMREASDDPVMGYEPVLDLDGNTAVLEFEDEGNIYGAGYGEGAVVINTQVNIYGGTIRNSVYGGGEIAAVGQGVVLPTGDAADIEKPGTTLVRMYGGLVEGDVFGGGRGYTYTFAYTGEDSPYKAIREYTDGYVFGKTAVEIYRGTVGTLESVVKGKGNVFGGGNIGYVYSPGVKYTEETNKATAMFNGHYYYRGDDPNTDKVETTADRTEDCRVLISASCVALEDLTIDGVTYKKGAYVPTEELNKLGHHDVGYLNGETDNHWEKLDDVGIHIRNAVFAGGNVSSGSDIVYANAVTVFGNVTASVIDLYNKDLVAIGGEHIGGLYGDGNLTFVDGYRELNITNYGTDYYTLKTKAEIAKYEFDALAEHDQQYYMLEANGEYKLREGRILNTIQRADFCGIFGSRILLYGAQDRVPDEVDYTYYAINRVGEISLNIGHNKVRGNYLGIYNVAKFFGALTSDVDFNNKVDQYKHKAANLESPNRNKGTSRNVLAQASGVYLELIKGLDDNGKKIYGPITGLVELELINMAVGEGGGYVYAKKEYGLQHEMKEGTTKEHLTLSTANRGAITSSAFTYDAPTGTMQTSGNFVHDTRTILDDAYSEDAHYWYVQGEYYNHDIVISAYAGSAQTFSNSTSIPFAVSTLTDGILKLEEVTTDIHDLTKNEVSRGAGYVLNLAMSNPLVWNQNEPTYTCNETGIYGQRQYAEGDLVSQTVIVNHEALGEDHMMGDEGEHAIFEPAYIATQEVIFDYNGNTHHMYAGSYISKTMYDELTEAVQQCYKPAYICINTIEVDDKEYVLYGELISETEKNELATELGNRVNIEEHFLPAYLCTKEGVFGGKKFEQGKKYSALEYVNLSKEEREYFTFNYDVLDLLVTDFDENVALYGTPFCDPAVVDYMATYVGINSSDANETATIRKNDGSTLIVKEGDVLSHEQFKTIVNEQAHYMPIVIDDITKTYYVVNTEFEVDITSEPGISSKQYYYVGMLISAETYESLNDVDKECIAELPTVESSGTWYYCIEDYGNTKKGTIISSDDYNKLPNDQKNFLVESVPSTTTATLYVPRESNILNLSEDRTVTAVYKHSYIIKAGDGYEKRTEMHNVNIHIQFKNGQPTIGDLNAPKTVLPNSTIGLSLPTVTPGAYEVLGSGWEIYRTEGDANTHQNGTPYVNNATPMYWYQNGYYVAYYTKTYLGRTYSKPIPLSIANYHRMGEVMSHVVNGKHEYMYIDHADVERAAKIYLDSTVYASTSIAADSIHKNDLDFLHDLYVVSLMPDSLDARVSRCDNLEFILRSDIAPKHYTDWTSIGNEGSCFAGIVHGNGYTISGLNSSLFGNLCGSVYNLGVTGSFTGGGVADNGGAKGFAENCWVYTSSKPAANAVIGQGGSTKNSYYRTDNGFKDGAIAKDRAAFEMGEVTYLLNGFYLDKRHTSQDNVQKEYNATGYVEKYFADGDFRYANGIIPMTADERYSEGNGQGRFTPIYPDDYIYFGQRITYAMTEKEANDKGLDLHNSFPVRIMKSENDGKVRIIRSHGNRVYRAPAYKQSKHIDKVYFNSYAHFVDSCKNMPIHHNVTAIDFTGHQDYNYTDAASGYRPYLDYEGIEHYTISGLTSNLLIYADPVGDAASYSLFEKLYVPVLVYGKNNGSGYVNEYNELSVQLNLNQVHGHLVDLVVDEEGNRSYMAKRDQILVDKEDYNAPIAYTFDDNCYMWHQRHPEYYTEGDDNGWDALCLPFTAVLTTTQDKGQITHFYGDNTTNNEYWLRKLYEVQTTDGEIHALFRRPEAIAGQALEVENKFLYDYYYSKFNDANNDQYQEYYSQETRIKEDYPFIEAYTPYIVAFPGKNFYEFDMSGQFVPANTGGEIAKLNPQVVTFVSKEKESIRVTDDALAEQTVKIGNYDYTGAFVNRARTNEYVINNVGGSFQNESGSIVPFRAYMTTPASGAPRRILIGNVTEEEEPIEDIANRGLTIYGKKEAIYIESTLEYEATVTIYSLSGQVVSRVKVMPMSKEVVTVPSRGVYIANNRKVAVL